MEVSECPVAVLLLVFNRPELARQALLRIRTVKPPRLYIHADGPRPHKPGEDVAVSETRKIISLIDWPCEVYTLFREENMGLRKGVGGAIDWFFNQEPYGIVIEDDCIPDPTFFPFCAELLVRYQYDERIMHIGGSNLLSHITAPYPADYLMTRFPFVWGWAGWRRAWQKMDFQMENLDEFISANKISRIVNSFPANIYLLDKLRATKNGAMQSWAYTWLYSIIDNDGVCILSTNNLTQNVGVGDPDATNTTGKNERARIGAAAVRFPLRHPVSSSPDPDLDMRYFYQTQKRKFRLWLWYILHLLKIN